MKRLVLCLALTGCVSTSEVVPAGRDSYMVSGSVRGGMLAGNSVIEATKTANAFCAKQSRVMILRHTQTDGNAGFGGEHSSLLFSCVDESDPEYRRPNVRKDPTTVIEDERH